MNHLTTCPTCGRAGWCPRCGGLTAHWPWCANDGETHGLVHNMGQNPLWCPRCGRPSIDYFYHEENVYGISCNTCGDLEQCGVCRMFGGHRGECPKETS